MELERSLREAKEMAADIIDQVVRGCVMRAYALEEIQISRADGRSVICDPDAMKWKQVAATLRQLANEALVGPAQRTSNHPEGGK